VLFFIKSIGRFEKGVISYIAVLVAIIFFVISHNLNLPRKRVLLHKGLCGQVWALIELSTE